MLYTQTGKSLIMIFFLVFLWFPWICVNAKFAVNFPVSIEFNSLWFFYPVRNFTHQSIYPKYYRYKWDVYTDWDRNFRFWIWTLWGRPPLMWCIQLFCPVLNLQLIINLNIMDILQSFAIYMYIYSTYHLWRWCVLMQLTLMCGIWLQQNTTYWYRVCIYKRVKHCVQN